MKKNKYIEFYPIEESKINFDIFTNEIPHKGIFRQLSINNYCISSNNDTDNEIYSYIDQAKVYFNDGYNSDWRSAGLLYYYSFLNLAKSLISLRKIINNINIKSISTYHGLSYKNIEFDSILNFKLTIHPQRTFKRNKIVGYNIFSNLYEAITNNKWPFNDEITISLAQILPYCFDVSNEIDRIYGINSNIILTQSLYRIENNKTFLELAIDNNDKYENLIYKNLEEVNLITITRDKLSKTDVDVWNEAYKLKRHNLHDMKLIRTEPMVITNGINNSIKVDFDNFVSIFRNLISPIPVIINSNDSWLFIPRIELNGETFHWHPLLSDYIFSFALSTILRYYPHLVINNSPDGFISESWCSQSPLTVLRYFLLSSTNPSIRLN